MGISNERSISSSRSQSFPGRYDCLEKIAIFVREAAQDAGLSEFGVYAVETAVDEACSNIIEHAYGGENRGDIECICEITPKGLSITLHDHGRKFDPTRIPKPNLSSNLDERESHGLGLYFMHKLMDQVCFRFSDTEGNTLIMEKWKEKRP